jgi:hypothetical protein
MSLMVAEGFHKKEIKVTKVVTIAILLFGIAALAAATPVSAPEINPGAAGSALALLSGATLVFRGSRKNSRKK